MSVTQNLDMIHNNYDLIVKPFDNNIVILITSLSVWHQRLGKVYPGWNQLENYQILERRQYV